MDANDADEAGRIVATLRACEPELRETGILHLGLFGSVARGEAASGSDIDLIAEFDPAANMDLIRLVGLERSLEEKLGRRVDIVTAPTMKPRLMANIERDRVRVF
jgi:predicted nucleotidyltransferase